MVSKFVHSFQTNLNNVSVQVHWIQARPQICTFFGALNSLIHDSISDILLQSIGSYQPIVERKDFYV